MNRTTIRNIAVASAIAGIVCPAAFGADNWVVPLNTPEADKLREAQRDPAKYRNLQVRLCGWNVRFVDLDRAHQDWIISEAEGSGK